MEIHESIYLLLMLLTYVMRRAGTFTLEEKMKMIDFIGYIARNRSKLYSNLDPASGE